MEGQPPSGAVHGWAERVETMRGVGIAARNTQQHPAPLRVERGKGEEIVRARRNAGCTRVHLNIELVKNGRICLPPFCKIVFAI